ncbi:hypothetical protein N7478_009248 [Penicillium angulare]|uniref:uncharacterized protein n=1 Tax=Penicillium angulare TaxID=116970 RepID=UPI00254239DF|nr:uncharacterized protein N7478_009248 [Penicillium angulare]KAJ5274123.1 hypothetical protein N7478_009248 [Penicillium angulare]
MASENSSLYGKRRAKNTKHEEISNSSNLAFSTQLSSLIAQDSGPLRGRARPSKGPKSDLFSKANKGTEKRAAADLRDGRHTQPYQSSKDIGSIDDATISRSKRKMEQKVRQYNDMKKGLYLTGDSSDDEEKPHSDKYLSRLRRKEKEGLVDFDRKWADEERKRGSLTESESESEADDNASIVSYEDEFGRSRRGTRKEAALSAQTKEEEASGHLPDERWKPARPENLIYGATVQSEAFNPEENTAAKMAGLAARRDRSATPPEEVHYNAEGEVRNRGTGFYSFSTDEVERRKQMEGLTRARQETEVQRQVRAKRRVEWEETTNQRRRELAQLREKRMTQRLLNGLPNDLLAFGQPKQEK